MRTHMLRNCSGNCNSAKKMMRKIQKYSASTCHPKLIFLWEKEYLYGRDEKLR